MSTILTDDEIKAVRQEEIERFSWKFNELRYARAVEAAVLAKLAQQEPVAWHTEDHLTDRSATTYSKEAMRRWQGKGWPVTPLYTHPAPQQADRQRVPEGWKLVPMEPTREMWAAVNKLDDQCAAGNYDGKGCSIEQAWDCLLAAAPEAPAQADDLSINPVTLGRTPWAYGEAPANTRNSWELNASAVDERAAFEAWLGIKPCGASHEFGWAAWQARAALAQKGGAA